MIIIIQQPFAEAVQQRSKTLLQKLDEQLESTIITVVHDLGKVNLYQYGVFDGLFLL